MGSKAPSTTTQKVEPWDAAKPYYTGLYSAAQTALDATPKTAYTGDIYAGPNDVQKQALTMFQAAAPGASAGADALRQVGVDTAMGKYLSPDSNPYLAGAVTAANAGIRDDLTRRLLPSIQDQSISQGAFGGAGNGVQNALAMSDYDRQALDAAQKIYYQNYASERQNQLNAGQTLSTAGSLEQLPAQIMSLVGGQQQSWDQAALDAKYQQYQQQVAAPFNGLGEFSQILNGGGFNNGTGTATPGGGGIGGAIQGTVGLASAVNSLFPKALPAAGNWLANLFSGGANTMSAATMAI